MRPFARRGNPQREDPPDEELAVGETSGPDVVVESGSYDVPKSSMPVELVKASIATRQEWV